MFPKNFYQITHSPRIYENDDLQKNLFHYFAFIWMGNMYTSCLMTCSSFMHYLFVFFVNILLKCLLIIKPLIMIPPLMYVAKKVFYIQIWNLVQILVTQDDSQFYDAKKDPVTIVPQFLSISITSYNIFKESPLVPALIKNMVPRILITSLNHCEMPT